VASSVVFIKFLPAGTVTGQPHHKNGMRTPPAKKETLTTLCPPVSPTDNKFPNLSCLIISVILFLPVISAHYQKRRQQSISHSIPKVFRTQTVFNTRIITRPQRGINLFLLI